MYLVGLYIYCKKNIISEKVVNGLEILFVSVQSSVKDSLNMCCCAVNFVSHLLGEEHKESHVNMYHDTQEGP